MRGSASGAVVTMATIWCSVGYDDCFGGNDFDSDVLWMGAPSTCESKNSVEAFINLP